VAGELIYLEGEPAQQVWFVKQGAIALSRKGGENHAEGRVHAVRFAGGFVGLEALVSDRYHDSARATEDAILCGITRAALDGWLEARSGPARAVLELVLRAQCGEPPRRAPPDGSAIQRVATWLVDEEPRGASLRLPRRIIADLLGMRPETLSRALAALTGRGVIAATRTEIAVLDRDRLGRLAGREPVRRARR
jgi:CRP-like cAMP-binding protein